MKILVINTGSSSLKYQLFGMENTGVAASGIIERIGEKESLWIHNTFAEGQKETSEYKQHIEDHKAGMHLVADKIAETGRVDAIGHRVVQGGEDFGSAVIINERVKQAIRDNFSLAPLHNPANLIGIEVAEELFQGIPNVAVFDTEFHRTIPEKAYLYALPYEYYTDFKIRRYGFHGTSHKYISIKTCEAMGKSPDDLNLITIHLGNGCSMCAVKKGRCVDTSMGMTPLAGIMMGTRTGDIDPAIISYLLQHSDMDMEELDGVLNKESGLKGICGLNDMRDIHKAASENNRRARLAVDMFCYRIKKYIGAYAAALGRVDSIVFSGGVGENDEIVRAECLSDLLCFGIEIDHEKNMENISGPFAVHSKESRVQIWVVPTNEELQIAREVFQVIQ